MSNQIDLKNWKPVMGDTGVVLFMEFNRERGSRGRTAAILHSLPSSMQSLLNLDGYRIHADLSTYYALVNDPIIKDYNPIKYMRYVLQSIYPEMFGSDLELSEEFKREYSSDLRVLENPKDKRDFGEGYHCLCCPEPLIVEPNDWTDEEWVTICKLCGLDKCTTKRIVMNVSSIEFYKET